MVITKGYGSSVRIVTADHVELSRRASSKSITRRPSKGFQRVAEAVRGDEQVGVVEVIQVEGVAVAEVQLR